MGNDNPTGSQNASETKDSAGVLKEAMRYHTRQILSFLALILFVLIYIAVLNTLK